MELEEIKAYCLAKPQAYEDLPFWVSPICCIVRGKICAVIYPDQGAVQCAAFSGPVFGQAVPGVVVRGYHCPPVQQPYWNTVYLDGFPGEELPMIIDHAYETVVASFSKKIQKEILHG